METGAFGLAPKNMAHFAWSKTETILQVHGIGLFASTLVDPAYELTDKGTTSSPPDCFALKTGARVRGDGGVGLVVAALCSPANRLTQYWVQKPNGDRFWATLQELKQL